ncbi:MAG: outer membrane beta-barrel protein [Sphingomonas bacterium]|nr:outer membrane beta-barrel protein [Sphingomonas bacterium]
MLAAVAAVAIATPALARDGSPYVGIEGGLMIVEDIDSDITVRRGAVATQIVDAYKIDFKRGFDVDAIAGYDFGMFRLEGELAYKRARVDDVRLSSALGSNLGVTDADFSISNRVSVVSLMANGLVDFGDDDGWAGYVGAGVGRARVRLAGDNDSSFAYQGIAGVRKAITPNIDLGLKYRYFRTASLNFNDEFAGTAGLSTLNSRAKLRTHSLLASLIYNFAAPAPVIVEPVFVAPPAPPAPATQTCADGSVILATDICPAPPAYVPPAPPEPMPERG